MSSLEHFPAKESKPRQRRARVNVAPASYGVREFCDAHNISRTQLYGLWAAGTGPRVFKIGTKIFVTGEAAAAWRAAMEAATNQT
jgi:hypothetical protein